MLSHSTSNWLSTRRVKQGTRIEAWTSPDGLAKCSGEGTAKCGPCCQQKGDPWCTKTDPPSAPACGRMNSTNSGNLCSADYNGMLAPILPMRFKAMIWYQVRGIACRLLLLLC